MSEKRICNYFKKVLHWFFNGKFTDYAYVFLGIAMLWVAISANNISNNSLEISKNTYRILELEKTSNMVLIDINIPEKFDSYAEIILKLENIGGIDTECEIILNTEMLYCGEKTISHFNETNSFLSEKEYLKILNFFKQNNKTECKTKYNFPPRFPREVKFSIFLQDNEDCWRFPKVKIDLVCTSKINNLKEVKELLNSEYNLTGCTRQKVKEGFVKRAVYKQEAINTLK